MDPITAIIVFTLFSVLFGGGTGLIVRRRRRKEKRRELREVIRLRVFIDSELELSIFDVFWDLGVSDFALEIMGKQRLLPEDHDDVPIVHEALKEAIDVHGSYGEFIRETLEAIQEFYEEHRKAGNRRNVPALDYKPYKTLPLPAVGGEEDSPETSSAGSGNLPVRYTGGHLPVVARDFEERMSTRKRSGGDLTPLEDGRGYEVDVDELTRVDPIQMLKGLFDGDIASRLQKWWDMRALRGLRAELDRELTQLYRFYADQAHRHPNFYDHLYDTARRWKMESERIADLEDARPWKGRPWELCADALVAEASAVARRLAWVSRRNIDETLERIHEHARGGDTAMAGYLVYLNHHAFFAGRTPSYDDRVRRIENTTYRIQQELRELMSKGVI